MPESYASIEVRLLEALNTLYTQTLPNVTQAARDFNVPYQRLLARFYGVQSKQDRPASGRKLTDVEELAVCQYLNQLDKMGTSARLSMLVGCANSILRAREADSTTQPPTISAAWSKRFLRRHPEYKMKKQQSLEIARKNSHDPEHILWWFAQYSKVRLENGIADEDVWNFDETGFRIGVGKSQWIITRDLTRKSFLASDNNRKTVTCIETVSGSGSVIPVFLILPGVIHQARWYEEVEDGTAIALSDNIDYRLNATLYNAIIVFYNIYLYIYLTTKFYKLKLYYYIRSVELYILVLESFLIPITVTKFLEETI